MAAGRRWGRAGPDWCRPSGPWARVGDALTLAGLAAVVGLSLGRRACSGGRGDRPLAAPHSLCNRHVQSWACIVGIAALCPSTPNDGA